ncbi:thiamine pyrophosphate-binding protein [Roseateles sp. SL47]|uniref:thiamine pyrophosphate-binding protein n=1 Tax=Roseateles sp. SL47 TaxID=2995138 RepID=UPI002271A170|nr:thiamine pyrophosphate-binding protein [Roseateles sp. SL47]WAC75102.1 thiamine pyrophosphate-binding protein [Roseateles sp. SL47]
MTQSMFRRHFRTPGTESSSAVRPLRASAAAGPATETIASYLNKRLAEIGVRYVMAIPGDYISDWVETLDDPEVNAGLVRVHPNNEMCATYAADGFGRAGGGKTVGCVSTTYGVGALNAVQAVAGAYVEHVPLVLVNGSPSVAQFNSQRDQGVLWHHMFDGSLTDLRIYEQITRMAIRIDNPALAPDLIDAALTACITDSRPVYIEIANTLEGYAVAPVSGRAKLKKSPIPQNTLSLDEAMSMVLPILVDSKRLVVLGGVEVARFGIQDRFRQMLKVLKAPFLSSLLGKSILSEYDTPYFSGTYNGRNSQQNVQDLVNAADVILSLGVQETDFNFSGVASADFNPLQPPGLPLQGSIEVRMGAARINAGLTLQDQGELYWGDIQLEAFVGLLQEVVCEPSGPAMQSLVSQFPALAPVQAALQAANGQLPNAPFPGLSGDIWSIPKLTPEQYRDQITWDSFKSLLHHNYLTSFGNDENQDAPVLLADTGLTFYNLNNVKVPQNGFIAQLAWGAIGYSPAASYGVKLAQMALGSRRRVISVSGDGAFSQSSNAIGTIAALGLDNVVFVMANGVFAIEQFLINAQAFNPQSKTAFAPFTRVPETSLWQWVKLAEGFGGVGYEVTTNAELADVLEKIKAGPPQPAQPNGPCSGSPAPGCCTFAPDATPDVRPSTFTLVAVRNVCNDLPSNTRWKLG